MPGARKPFSSMGKAQGRAGVGWGPLSGREAESDRGLGKNQKAGRADGLWGPGQGAVVLDLSGSKRCAGGGAGSAWSASVIPSQI